MRQRAAHGAHQKRAGTTDGYEPVYYFGESTEISKASVQVMSSWSPTFS